MHLLDRRPALPSVGRARLVLPVLAFLLAAAALIQLGPVRGPLHSFEPALGSVALAVAGAPNRVPIGYVGVGIARLYLTALPLALLAGGVVAAATESAVGTVVGVLLGLAAAGTLTGLNGCHCGSGSSAFLVEWAVAAA